VSDEAIQPLPYNGNQSPDKSFTVGGQTFQQADGPFVMGVINRSPESPTHRAYCPEVEAALRRADLLRSQWAAIIDIGGQSTHCTSPLVSESEESDRICTTIEALKHEGHLVSAETWRVKVAQQALTAGADMINDTGGLQSTAMLAAIARVGAAAMAMYLDGSTPRDAQPLHWTPQVSEQISAFFQARLRDANAVGIGAVLCDVGIGIVARGESDDGRAAYRDRLYAALPQLATIPAPLAIQLHLCHDEARDLAMIRYLVEDAGIMVFRAHDVEPVMSYRRSCQ
jgi:dihydropteroate synthase